MKPVRGLLLCDLYFRLRGVQVLNVSPDRQAYSFPSLSHVSDRLHRYATQIIFIFGPFIMKSATARQNHQTNPSAMDQTGPDSPAGPFQQLHASIVSGKTTHASAHARLVFVDSHGGRGPGPRREARGTIHLRSGGSVLCTPPHTVNQRPPHESVNDPDHGRSEGPPGLPII